MFFKIYLKGLKRRLAMAVPLPLALLLAAYVLIRSVFWDVPPIWDGQTFYGDLLAAFRLPFDLLRYSTEGHISQGLYLLLGAPLLWSSRNYVLFNIGLTAFSTLGVIAFYHLAGMAARMSDRWEQALAAALFAFSPSVLASMIHFNLDAGVLTFLLLFWLMLWKGYDKTAIACGTLALFSKETACLLLPLPFLFCLLSQPRKLWIPWIFRRAHILALPYLLLAGFLYYKVIIRHYPPFWNGPGSVLNRGKNLGSLLFAHDPTAQLMNYLFMIFVMNFQWVCAGLWAVFLGIGIARKQPVRTSLLLGGFLLAATFLLTRIMLSTNARYVMAAAPVLLLGMLSATPRDLLSAGKRKTLYAGLLLLLAMQNIRSVDPLTNTYFGTVDFGSHKMLDMTSRTHECCGYGRDQLVYNLEFLMFPKTIMAIMQDMRPSESTYIALPERISWHMLPPLDPITYRPTFAEGGFTPHYVTPRGLLRLPQPPSQVYFIALAYDDHQRAALRTLERRYAHQQQKRYDLGGFHTTLYLFSDPILGR